MSTPAPIPTAPVENFARAIADAGIEPPDEIIADGGVHRFATNGKRGDDAGWYILHSNGIPAGAFGDWRSDVTKTWCARRIESLSPAEREEHRRRIEAARREAEAERARTQEEAAKRAAELWARAKPETGEHRYLRDKHVQAHGIRTDGERLLIPMRDAEGKPWNIQRIAPNGTKRFLPGGRTKGLYFGIGRPDGVLVIAEGFATAASIHEATGHAVAVAFSAGNLRAVAEALRKKLGPDVRLIIAGDNDAIETGTGQKAAIEAARAVGGLVAIPESPKTDWNDIAKAEGSKAVRKGIEAAVSLTAELGTSPTDWPEPREIASSGPAHQFPVDDLPPLLREAVCEAQSVIQCPVPMVAASAIAALSTAAQGLADVQRDAQLCGPVSLYLLVIAESGERKSTADGWFFGALRDWQRGRVTEMVPEVRRHHADFEAWMAEKDGVKQAIKALRKAGKPTDAKRDNLRSLEDCKPIGPLVPTLEIEDATPESIAHRLRFDWPSAALISAEAGAVLGGHAMGSDSLQRTLALLNKLWSGEALRIDRRTKESFVLDGARLTCGLAIQREGLDAFLSATGALARGSGFLARFLLCEPKSTQGTRLYRSPPAETPARARYVRALTDLLDLRLPMATGRLSPPALGLAPTAKGVWIDFYDEVERSLTGDLREARDTAAKAADNVVRLAALFHILENGPEGEITEASCRMATAVVTWFLFEARRFFRETTPALTVTKLEQWLRTQPPEGVPIRTVQQFGPYAARRPDSFKAAVAILTDAGRARIEGEHPPKLVLNPALRG